MTEIKRPNTSPLLSPRPPVRHLSGENLSQLNLKTKSPRVRQTGRPESATFSLKFRGHRSWTVDSRVDMGERVKDEARFRDFSTEVTWADFERLSKDTGVNIPPAMVLLPPPLRAGLIKRWLELIVSSRGLDIILSFLEIDEQLQVKIAPRRLFSRTLSEVEELTLL